MTHLGENKELTLEQKLTNTVNLQRQALIYERFELKLWIFNHMLKRNQERQTHKLKAVK